MEYIKGGNQHTLSFFKKQCILSHLDACLENDRENNLKGLDESAIKSSRRFAIIFAKLYMDQVVTKRQRPCMNKALEGYEKALGLEHLSTLEIVNSLGTLYKSQGKLVEAEAMYERALVEKEKTLGPQHTSTLGTVNNLGNFYVSKGKLAKAEAMYERALAGTEKALGSNTQ